MSLGDWNLVKKNTLDYYSVIVNSSLEYSTSDASTIVDANLFTSSAELSRIIESNITNSALIESLLYKSTVKDSHIHESDIIKSSVYNCRIAHSVVEANCHLENITLSNAYIKRGYTFVDKPPTVLVPTSYSAPYAITQLRPGYALIGCCEKPLRFWLSAPPELFTKRLNIAADAYEEYIALLRTLE